MYTTDTRMPTAVRRHPPVVDKAAETTAWCGLVRRGLVRRGPVQRTTTLPTTTRATCCAVHQRRRPHCEASEEEQAPSSSAA